jgi:hypothetical protein
VRLMGEALERLAGVPTDSSASVGSLAGMEGK